MTSYFQHNDNKTKPKPKRTEHGTEIVEIASYLVTEGRYDVTVSATGDEVKNFSPAEFRRRLTAASQKARDSVADAFYAFDEPPSAAEDHIPGATWSGNDRHGWACPCVGCRTDRGEE